MDDIFKDLNPEQRNAVECLEGPVLIVAGAGSGKTRVLTSRIAYAISRGVPPERILALTFTKKAANEMKERIAAMVGPTLARRLWMGTFHSVFVRFLREWADVIGFPKEFTIYDQSDSVSAVKTCVRELGLDDKTYYKPKEVASRISKAKNDLVTPTPYRDGAGGFREDDRIHKKPEIYRIYARYCELCKKSGVMDFDDILIYMNILLRDSPEALSSIAGRFSLIMVDEYQDTNMAQYLILKKLAAEHKNLCVVGDDSQSIYAFRGAQIQNILNFRKDFQGARLFRLERNYRSTRNIVNAANSLIAHNEGRIPKTCVSMGEEGEKLLIMNTYTAEEEASRIASEILRRMREDGASDDSFAILYRTNSQSRILEEYLRKRNIPYRIWSGNSFFDRAEVKDVMSYFKLAVNHADDESFRRAVNKPARGIGDTTVHALEAAARAKGLPLMKTVFEDDLESFGLKAASVKKLREFCKVVLDAGVAALDGDAYDTALRLANESGLWLYFKSDISIEGQSRAANVQELLDSVKTFVEDVQGDWRNAMLEDGKVADISEIDEKDIPYPSLADYLENTSLLSNADVDDDEISNKVALMTVHSAKGLEFPYVFVAGLEENLFPSGGWMLSERELEEERRLCYVAITRAKKTVTLSFAQTRMRNGKHESNSPSRFIREIGPQYFLNPLTRESFNSESPFSRRDSSSDSGFGGGYRWQPKSQPSRPQPSRPQPRPEPVRPVSKPQRMATPPVVDPDFIPDPMSSFKVGERIEHNRFGAGIVLEITGQIPELKAKIQFDNYGEKLLLLKYAKLRHIKP